MSLLESKVFASRTFVVATGIVFLALASISATGAEANFMIISTNAICREPGRYIGWPTICKTRQNELLVVFSGDRDAHVCPWGVTQLVRSLNDARTWSEPVTINNTPLDDRDAGILETKSGTLVVSWFTSLAFETPGQVNGQKLPEAVVSSWKRHAAKLGSETREEWLGNWTRRSTDGGRTWEKPVRQTASAPHGPITLRDGRLVYIGRGTRNGKPVMAVEESLDEAKSWRFVTTVPVAAGDSVEDYWEPHALELADGKLLAMFRYEPKDRSQSFMRQAESVDGGKNWTTTHPTPIWGLPPHLLQLRNGWLVVVYGVRRPPFSERACLSKDGGRTWDIEHEIILRPALSGDLGYPSSVQLPDDSILTVYYQAEQPGEKTSLLSTHWRLRD